MSVCVRRATESDRPRILEISSQIWDGEDYVPELLNGWLVDREGEVVVATLDEYVIAFAHRTWLCPGIAWLEGIRADPTFHGRGAGRAITDYLVNRACQDGASSITLSTYIDNKASIHLLESQGFNRVASFSVLERPEDSNSRLTQGVSHRVESMDEIAFREFVGRSDFLKLGHRRFPRGWRFFPFDHNPREAVARLERRWGIREGGEWCAALSFRQAPSVGGGATLTFLDGTSDCMRELLAYALPEYAECSLVAMVPFRNGEHASALGELKRVGFKSWSDFKADVFVYEMIL